jgi:hypothetical protein
MWSTADTVLRRLVMAAAAVVLAGCQSGPACMPWKHQMGDEAFRGLTVTEPALHDRIGVLSRTLHRTAGQPPSVNVELVNCSRSDLVLALRSRFAGAGGVGEAVSGWRRVYLAPGSSARYVEHAIDGRSHDVQVEVIDANRAQPGLAMPADR